LASSLRLGEINNLYEQLSPEERDNLLQGLLIAAPRRGEAMIEVLEQLLLCEAVEEFCDKWVRPLGNRDI
jgi:hypothetical protein